MKFINQKKCISMILVSALIICSVTMSALASEVKTRPFYYMRLFSDELEETYSYSDDYFKVSGKTNNNKLLTMSYCLALPTFEMGNPQYINSTMENIGFDNIFTLRDKSLNSTAYIKTNDYAYTKEDKVFNLDNLSWNTNNTQNVYKTRHSLNSECLVLCDDVVDFFHLQLFFCFILFTIFLFLKSEEPLTDVVARDKYARSDRPAQITGKCIYVHTKHRPACRF